MFSRRHFLLGSVSLPLFADRKPTPERPNIVLLAAGDLGAWMLGCYGNKEIRTPNLDRMAQTGARFAASFSSAPAAGAPAWVPPAALAAAGYATQTASGADETCRFVEQQVPGKPFLIHATLHMAEPSAAHEALYAQAKFDGVGYEGMSPRAARNQDRFRNTLASVRRAAASVTALDERITPVFDCLRKRGLLDNTLVIFTSTRGALLGRHGLWGDGNASQPPNFFDEVAAVPMLWSWPSRIPPASVRPELVGSYDLAPTLCELAGVPAPATGRSYLTLAMNKPLPKKQPWRNLVFGRLGNTEMVRDNRFKLVARNQGDGPNELYDVAADPREKTNQHDNPQFVTVRTRLAADLASWRKQPGG